jgi:hypothetical protein
VTDGVGFLDLGLGNVPPAQVIRGEVAEGVIQQRRRRMHRRIALCLGTPKF